MSCENWSFIELIRAEVNKNEKILLQIHKTTFIQNPKHVYSNKHRPHLNLRIPFFRIVGVEKKWTCVRVWACAYDLLHRKRPCLICGEDLEKRVIIMTNINMCHEHPFVWRLTIDSRPPARQLLFENPSPVKTTAQRRLTTKSEYITPAAAICQV